MGEVIKFKARKQSNLYSRAKAELRKRGFKDHEMDATAMISTSDPRLQRLVADALRYMEASNARV